MSDLTFARSSERWKVARLALFEARPAVLVLFAVRFAVGGVWGGQTNWIDHLWIGVVGQLAWFSAVWWVYLINGISDLAGDRVNGSSRPLASGALDLSAARAWCTGLFVTSLSLSILVGPAFFLLLALFLSLGAWYSLGNRPAKAHAVSALAVAGVGCFTSYVGGALAYGGQVGWDGLAFSGVMSVWMFLAGHNKDLSDIVGDAHSGRRTLPMLVGARAAARSVGLAAVGLSAGTLYLVGIWPSLDPLVLLVPSAVAMLVSSVPISSSSSSTSLRRPYRIFMISQYVINVTTVAFALRALFP